MRKAVVKSSTSKCFTSIGATQPEEELRVPDAHRRGRSRLRPLRRRRHGSAATTGEIVWRTRFPYDSQHGGSPTLYKDLLIFSCDGSDRAFVVALDKTNGAVRWKTAR